MEGKKRRGREGKGKIFTIFILRLVRLGVAADVLLLLLVVVVLLLLAAEHLVEEAELRVCRAEEKGREDEDEGSEFHGCAVWEARGVPWGFVYIWRRRR